ncbi:MAG: DUF5104 domain-containing protein [Clostridiales bacterium]|nr:DUF5104 domain-containing protein [Clostridiales bacterium]
MKRRILGIVLFFTLGLSISSCSSFKEASDVFDVTRNTAYMDERGAKKLQERTAQKIVDALDNGDEDKLLELFSDYTLKISGDQDDGLDYVFDLYEGTSTEISDYKYHTNETSTGERLVQMAYFSCTIETDEETYKLYWEQYARFSDRKDHVGLCNMRLLKADEDKEYQTHGALLGIETPEYYEISNVISNMMETTLFGDPGMILSDDLLDNMSEDSLYALDTFTTNFTGDTVSAVWLEDDQIFATFEILEKGQFVAAFTYDNKITGIKVTEYIGDIPSNSELEAKEGKVKGLSDFKEIMDSGLIRYNYGGERLCKVMSLYGFETPSKKSADVGFTDSNIGGWNVYKLKTGFDSALYWVKGDVCCYEDDLEDAEEYFRDYSDVKYSLHQYIYGGNKDPIEVDFDDDIFWEIYDVQFTDEPAIKPNRVPDAGYLIYRTSDDDKFTSRFLIYIFDDDAYIVDKKSADDQTVYLLDDDIAEYLIEYADEYCEE